VVIITHAHPDHVGGTLDDEGQPVYPNARYYIWKDEWNFWFSEMAFTKAPESFVTVWNLFEIRSTLLTTNPKWCPASAPSRHLAIHPATWWCPFVPVMSVYCTSAIRCCIPFIWSTRTGSRSKTSSLRKLPPASAGSLIGRRRRGPWWSASIFLPSQARVTWSSRGKDGNGSRLKSISNQNSNFSNNFMSTCY
jgi:hypothetical protein